jgi:hypothetical protein
MSRIPYYYRQSWGVGTNLQLHSLRQAWRLWADLRKKQDLLRPRPIRERCVAIIDLLGLSISQLLGQNFSHSLKLKIPSLEDLWNSLQTVIILSKDEKKSLNHRFKEFLIFYNDCRHFGSAKHDKIDTLTLETTAEFVELALNIWDTVCGYFKSANSATINFDSVRNILDENEDEEGKDE